MSLESERCDEIRSELTAFLDGELSAGQDREVRDHLRECSSCRLERSALEQTWALLDLLEPIQPGEESPSRFRERVLRPNHGWRANWRVGVSAVAAVFVVALAAFFWNPAIPGPSSEFEAADREVIANLDRLGAEGFDIGLKMALLDNLHVLDQFSTTDLEWIRQTRFEAGGISGGR